MARFSIIDSGVVANHAEASAEFAASHGWVPAGDSHIGDLWDGERYATPTPALNPLPAAQASAIAAIDAAVDRIYSAVIGNRQTEYEAAERQARAFSDGGHALETVPGMVQSWANAKGWSAAQAANDILTQAAQWRAMQELIRAQRLLRKEQVRSALDADELAAATQAWSAFVATIRAQLGLLGPAEVEAR